MGEDLWTINSGDMRFRVEIQRYSGVSDSKGEKVRNEANWSTIATRWASITPASGQRFTASDEIRNAISHKIVMRYFAGFTPKTDRIKYGSRKFNVLSILDEGNVKVRQTALATEVL